jgi:hypothetical protein
VHIASSSMPHSVCTQLCVNVFHLLVIC